MDKKIAVVTGGTGGIGSAICKHLASNYQVIACYFKNGNHDEAKRWQEEQRKTGFDMDILYADISKFADCEEMAHLILEKYGQVDVLVNNAGITADTSLKKMSPEQWQQVIDANLTSVFNVTRTILPSMLDKGYGRIISISSINGRKGQFGQCNYAATKAALFGFTKSLALEVASKGITVNTISPGYIETPMLAAMKEEVLNAIISNIPIGRLGKPEEIANVVAFLANPASGFITGANFDINGGQYM
ncbi:acetoacetyl-CoA reductase [Legionella anisa]|uniref:Beta-ketoacyl-ACP reductase n=1 Tax=Legionella anisa TaxID=28082 RepID=A0AAX0WZM8_9GAMM|nr:MULTISPECIES: acetoacetyl-CoA reductase [Legionella]HAT9164520.1 acetoacetyl-CoA reductase [Legionella pneumophila subsp. pneumophila]AOU90869.1 beta-ketoacyl-ACP reductase [Legionella pneumophila]AWN76050.1 acetoacetyl-CoA reductase [Legionella anisa]MCW8426861.1 acetoacetyl-CoA reductase [Legionella anisa]MCW8449598.1 acetoacetyl-CoA reductase [Legionella anisa]